MKTEKQIKEQLKKFKALLKDEINSKDWDNIGNTSLIINWLEWVLYNKW